MVVVYEITPWSPVKGDHASQGLQHMIYEERLKKQVLSSLEKRRLRGDFISAYSCLMKGQRTEPDSSKGCTAIQSKAMDIVGTWKILIRPKEFFAFFSHKYCQILELVPREIVGHLCLEGAQ